MDSGKYTVFKLLRIIFLIILIPLLAVSAISALTMLNTKNAGGYPNLFGYYVVEVPNNAFYDKTTGEYQEGSTQLFKSREPGEVSHGEMVAYYSSPSESPVEIAQITWWENFSNHIPTGSKKPASTLGAEQQTTKAPAQTLAAAPASEVLLGKISAVGSFVASDGVNYICYALFVSNEEGASDDLVIVAEDVLGVATENNSFLISFLTFASNFSSFLLLVFVPVVILVVLNVIIMIMSKSVSSGEMGYEKEKMRGGGRTPPPPPPSGPPPRPW